MKTTSNIQAGASNAPATYLGIDLGGTKLSIGEIDSQGGIVRSERYPTGYCCHERAVSIIDSSIQRYIAGGFHLGRKPKAIGLGLLGRVDSARGVWHEIDSSRKATIDVASMLASKYGMPCFIDNDVKSATRAEMAWGAGRRSDNFVYINVGTGIAVGIVAGGQLLRGFHNDAGEAGFTVTNVQLGQAGHIDTVEEIASGMGFDRCARLLKAAYPESPLAIPEGRMVAVADVFDGWRQGDRLCQTLVANAAQALATLVNNLVRTLDPELVVFGGGIMSDGTMLRLVKECLPPSATRLLGDRITLTTLDPANAGLLGAAAVAMGEEGRA